MRERRLQLAGTHAQGSTQALTFVFGLAATSC